jgi:hypothetical protein
VATASAKTGIGERVGGGRNKSAPARRVPGLHLKIGKTHRLEKNKTDKYKQKENTQICNQAKIKMQKQIFFSLNSNQIHATTNVIALVPSSFNYWNKNLFLANSLKSRKWK